MANSDSKVDRNIGWNLYGKGLDSFGKSGKPEHFPPRDPSTHEILVRVDAVGICFSDVKIINQGGDHPKLHKRDLYNDPACLGHEVALTVVKVGDGMKSRFNVGERITIQPDIFDNGKSTAFGYMIAGGFIQYQILGPDVLGDEGDSYVIRISSDLGYAETALTEPWACVEAAYTQRRRLYPLSGGKMWIYGESEHTDSFTFDLNSYTPSLIILSNVPDSLLDSIRNQCKALGTRIEIRDDCSPLHPREILEKFTDSTGFDDIVLLNPERAETVTNAGNMLARRGICNIIGKHELDGLVYLDAGRIHYDYIAFYGNAGTDINSSYGSTRNRCELRKGGVALYSGAGGPMGQMHLQRAIELADGPNILIASDVDAARLSFVASRFGPMATSRNKKLITFNSASNEISIHEFVKDVTSGRGVDDAIVCAPLVNVMEESAALLADDGMLVLFAGVPNGSMMAVNGTHIYKGNMQFTGTSGSDYEDQLQVVRKTMDGSLSPNKSVAAIGGIEAVHSGVEAVSKGVYPGKILIFPQVENLPLIGLGELRHRYPDIAMHLAEGEVWSKEAEEALHKKFT